MMMNVANVNQGELWNHFLFCDIEKKREKEEREERKTGKKSIIKNKT